MRTLRNRLATAGAGILLAAGLLTGCATETPELQETAARTLQLAVLDVTNAVKSGDLATAQAELTELENELMKAVEADEVTAARTVRIQSAIDLIRTDLATAIAAAEAEQAPPPAPVVEEPAEPDPEPAPAPAPAPVEQDNSGTGNDEKGDKNDDPGKGEDKGKGKGDDCKKDKDDC
jgi:ribosomal protein S20